MSLSDAARHTYLVAGVRVEDSARLAARAAEESTPRESLPEPMAPLSLHMQPGVALPITSNLREGADLTDQQWARRQFSVLWAPMPAEYQVDDGAQVSTTNSPVKSSYSQLISSHISCRLQEAAAATTPRTCGS
jgi:hypothetical protein